jgi:hypothetical protein
LISLALGGGRDRRRMTRSSGSSRGQSLVEFALLLPILLLIVLFAVDFGRIYMGWVTVNGMARIGANYAAQHPDAWTTPGDPTARAEYLNLMDRSKGALDCILVPPANPSFPDGRKVGKPAQSDVSCNFRVAAPIISMIVGNPVRVSASSTFPITYGCLAGCPPPPPDTPPPPPVSNCRTVPDMVGMSVEGAESAWVAAGFDADNVTKPVGALPTDTVATANITQPPDATFCDPGDAFFSSSVSFTLETPDPVPSPPTCLTLPNVVGMTVLSARAAWDATDFTGAFTPPTGASDPNIVISQTPSPDTTALPGDCVAPDTSLSVAYGAPPPPPPPPPCKVPSFVNTQTDLALGTWTAAGFTGSNLSFKQNPPPQYAIKSQSLVGGTYVSCNSLIVLAKS